MAKAGHGNTYHIMDFAARGQERCGRRAYGAPELHETVLAMAGGQQAAVVLRHCGRPRGSRTHRGWSGHGLPPAHFTTGYREGDVPLLGPALSQ